MKSKSKSELTSRQLKERREYDRMSVVSVTQKKAKASSKNIDIQHYVKFNADKLADIIKQIESVREGLKILASDVRTLK